MSCEIPTAKSSASAYILGKQEVSHFFVALALLGLHCLLHRLKRWGCCIRCVSGWQCKECKMNLLELHPTTLTSVKHAQNNPYDITTRHNIRTHHNTSHKHFFTSKIQGTAIHHHNFVSLLALQSVDVTNLSVPWHCNPTNRFEPSLRARHLLVCAYITFQM